MGFDRAAVEITCDRCGIETEAEELSPSPSLGGGYSLDKARWALRNDGWRVDESDKITCADCLNEEASQEQGGSDA